MHEFICTSNSLIVLFFLFDWVDRRNWNLKWWLHEIECQLTIFDWNCIAIRAVKCDENGKASHSCCWHLECHKRLLSACPLKMPREKCVNWVIIFYLRSFFLSPCLGVCVSVCAHRRFSLFVWRAKICHFPIVVSHRQLVCPVLVISFW